jgi:hypothetical protein
MNAIRITAWIMLLLFLTYIFLVVDSPGWLIFICGGAMHAVFPKDSVKDVLGL